LLILLLLVLLTSGCKDTASPKVIKIGLIAPFEGPSRPLGYDVLYAVKLRVKQWNEDEVSCHLDKRWDGLFVLNDINEGVDHLFETEVKKAFLRGLAMKWFKNYKDEETNTITWRFEFQLEGEKYKQDLVLQNGKPAGATFYHLYEALFHPSSQPSPAFFFWSALSMDTDPSSQAGDG